MPSQGQIDYAIKKSKENFDFTCIVTLQNFNLQGAHLCPRSTYPHWAAIKYGIVPLIYPQHSIMDALPRPADRIRWIRANVHPTYKPYLNAWLLLFLEATMESRA